MRQIEIHFTDSERYDNFRVGRDDKMQAAIGYLSTWCMNSYNRVSISLQFGREVGDAEFVAFYYREDDKGVRQPGQYTIGAIWHEDGQRFSFHS